MLDAELGHVALAVNDLRVVIIALGLNLLGLSLLEQVGLSLVHAHHVRVDRWSLLGLRYLLLLLVSFELVLLTGCHHGLLGVG